MPVQRVGKEFKDISATFKFNPLNDDLIALKNLNAISRSIRNLIFTVPGERPFNPVLGSNVSSLLFDNLDELTASAIETQIKNTIENSEPRVILIKVRVTPNFDRNAFDAVIQYKVVGIDVPAQELTFALELTR